MGCSPEREGSGPPDYPPSRVNVSFEGIVNAAKLTGTRLGG
jgi:hypothetical protein